MARPAGLRGCTRPLLRPVRRRPRRGRPSGGRRSAEPSPRGSRRGCPGGRRPVEPEPRTPESAVPARRPPSRRALETASHGGETGGERRRTVRVRARAPSPSLPPATRLPRGGSSASWGAPYLAPAASRFRRRPLSRQSRSWSSLAAHLRSARPRLRRPTREREGGRRDRRGALGHGRRRRGGFRCRVWCGRRLGRRGREGGAPRRKEGERVDVGLGGADADAQVDVRNAVLGLACWARLGKDVVLRDDVAAADVQRAQVGERDLRVADGDRHRQAVRRNGAGERHLSRDRSANRSRSLERHVDPAMLTGGVRVRTNREATEHRAVGRPCPGERDVVYLLTVRIAFERGARRLSASDSPINFGFSNFSPSPPA